MISFGRWVHVGRWWVDWSELRWVWADVLCAFLGHRLERSVLDDGDVVFVCRRHGLYQIEGEVARCRVRGARGRRP